MGAAPVTDGRWDAEVLRTHETVIVGFCASWSSPCRLFAPTVDELAAELAGRARVLALDIDGNPDAPRRYDVTSLPTLLVFRAGRLTARILGARPKDRLLSELLSHLD